MSSQENEIMRVSSEEDEIVRVSSEENESREVKRMSSEENEYQTPRASLDRSNTSATIGPDQEDEKEDNLTRSG